MPSLHGDGHSGSKQQLKQSITQHLVQAFFQTPGVHSLNSRTEHYIDINAVPTKTPHSNPLAMVIS